jgi:NTP pyrophosphatase (non-canonical NTP hydrolase)
MDIKTYHQETKRTSPPSHIFATGAPKNVQANMNLLLGVVGLADEAGEVLELFLSPMDELEIFPFDKLRKELGDVYWYASHICHVLEMDFEGLRPTPVQITEKATFLGAVAQQGGNFSLDFAVQYLSVETTKGMLGMVKKMLFHGHPFNALRIFEQLTNILTTLDIICRMAGTSPEEVWAENIAKLRARYPEKFETELSMNKDESNE